MMFADIPTIHSVKLKNSDAAYSWGNELEINWEPLKNLLNSLSFAIKNFTTTFYQELAGRTISVTSGLGKFADQILIVLKLLSSCY